MTRFDFSSGINLGFKTDDFLVESGQFGGASNFRVFGPIGQGVKLHIAPAIEKDIVFLEHQLKDFLGLRLDWSGLVGEIPSLGQIVCCGRQPRRQWTIRSCQMQAR